MPENSLAIKTRTTIDSESNDGKKNLTIVSLFSGCGGLDFGFEEAGFECVLALDNMPEAAETYKANFPNTPFLVKDIRLLTKRKINKLIGDKTIDVIVGGPPCQGFSNMGNKNSADPRNYLFEEYARIVDAIRPKCFLFENVKGLFTMFEGRFFDKVVNSFLEIGYNVYFSKLDASDYGVPQKRHRIIVFGTIIDREFQFPKHDSESFGALNAYSNVGDAINDLVGKENKVPNHVPLNHCDKVVRRYKLIPEGGKLPKPEDLPAEIRRKNFGNTYTRLNRADVSSTIVPGNNAFPVHPVLDRSLTPREAARIQTFPDSFILKCNRRSQCILIGNAVPPLLAAKLAKTVSDFIKNVEYDGIVPDGKAKVGTVFSRQNLGTPVKTGRATLKFADLFCGAGGFTKGLESAGLQCVLGVDNDPYAVKAHRANNKSHECLQLDLSSAKNQKLVIERLKKEGVQLIVGGPPAKDSRFLGNVDSSILRNTT
jgi:DNA (cytosine-5)-methyltransferase 1